MNNPKQLQFIAILLLAFALSLTIVPVCQAQLEGDTGSDEVGSGDTDSESGGSGSDTGSSGSDTVGGDSDEGETDSGDTETGSAGSGRKGLMVFQAAGPTAASIQSTVDAFRAALGDPNNGNNLSSPAGRREINWDGGGNVDTTTPPVTPFDVFLNSRGARFTTPGDGLSQAPPAGLITLFTNATYGTTFNAFSPLRLFTPVDSNITEALFFIPGMNPNPAGNNPNAPAKVTGFGAIFSDVDQPNGSWFAKGKNRWPGTIVEYYGAKKKLLFRGVVPASPGDATFSFFGVVFEEAIIARVRIRTGETAPGPNDRRRDIVVMDDFLYGEPQALP